MRKSLLRILEFIEQVFVGGETIDSRGVGSGAPRGKCAYFPSATVSAFTAALANFDT